MSNTQPPMPTQPPSQMSQAAQQTPGRAAIPIETRITAVTVYPDQAQVTHAGEIALDQPGELALRIGDLPLALQRESLRATGRGPAGMRILGVEQETQMHSVAPEETLRQLREQIERLEREVATHDERIRTLDAQQQWLRTLGEQTARSLAWGMARGTAKPADMGGFFSYASDESQRLASAKLDAQQAHNETQRQLEARRREYAQLGGARRPDRIAALVRIALPTPGPVSVELSYLIAGAEWHPRYDARVDATAGRVGLTQQAIVTQRTGADWSQVALALSTARPSAATRLPDEPPPWYLDVFRPPTPQPRMAAQVMHRNSVAGGIHGGGRIRDEGRPDGRLPLQRHSIEEAAARGRDRGEQWDGAAVPHPWRRGRPFGWLAAHIGDRRIRAAGAHRLRRRAIDCPRGASTRWRDEYHWVGAAAGGAACLPGDTEWR